MPELPEVETVRRGLEPVMAGARVERVEQRRPDLRFPFPERFVARVEGRRIEGLGRRAKYLLARLEGGEVLIMHLGMSGRFTVRMPDSVRSADAPGDQVGTFVHDTGTDAAHDHVVFRMESGAVITYNDPRRFGYMDLVRDADLDTCKHFAGLGPEPLSNRFDAPYLAAMAHRKATDLKAFLLDQRIVAGLGNIYVCEALFRSGLSPHRGASCLALAGSKPSQRCETLVPHIRAVLDDAIAAGGSTLRDYARTDGSLGYFQHSFKVYGREGEACVRPGCGGIVRRSVQAGRSTFHCTRCQR